MLGKIVSPRLEKLEKEFLESGGEWKEIRIGDIFEKQDLKFLKEKFDKNCDISKERTEEFSLPLVNAKNGENGVMYYGREKDFDSVEMSIDIVNDGAVSTGNVYAQPQRTGVLYNAYLIKLKDYSANSKILLYFTSVIEKSIKMKFGYDNKAGWNKVKEEEITLPFLKGEIYFSYMEKYIEELEALRIEELEAYLVATGLKNYRLTKYDEEVLDKFNRLSENSLDRQTDRQTDRIRLGDIFNIKTPKKKYNANAVEFGGFYPYVARGESNNGIKGYITKNANYLNDGNTISFGQDTATMFYQSEPYFTGDKIKVFEPKDFILSRHNALYFITATKKIINTFSWGTTLYNVGNLENIEVEMPIQNEKLDISFMEDFIKVVEKLVIKDIVIWADKKIAATKQIAGRN